jgi:hypothetical protein
MPAAGAGAGIGAAANQPPAMAASPATPDAGSNPEPDANAPQPPREEEAPLHRRALIRATLPRPVGEVPVRAIPTFTIREAAAARPNKFRHKGRPNGAARQGRQQVGPMSMGNQARPGNTRGPQGRGGAAKKAGGHQPHRAGGHQPARGGQKGPHGGGNKRFK